MNALNSRVTSDAIQIRSICSDTCVHSPLNQNMTLPKKTLANDKNMTEVAPTMQQSNRYSFNRQSMHGFSSAISPEEFSVDNRRMNRADDEKPTRFDFARQMFKSGKSRGARFWVFVALGVLVFIILFCVALFFLYFWKGNPNVNVVGIVPPENGLQNNGNIDLGNAATGASPSLLINMKLNVAISNPNRLDLSLENVQINVFHPLVPTLQIAQAHLDSLFLPKEGTVLQVIPLSLNYKFSDDSMSQIPKDLVASCTIQPGKHAPEKQLQLNVAIDATLHVTSLIKPKLPTIMAQPSFDCPFTSSPIINVAGVPINLAQIDWSAIQQGKLGLLPA